MSAFNNPFVNFLKSGFGTNASPAVAVGWALLIILFGFLVVWKIGEFIYKIVMKYKAHKASQATQDVD